MQKRVLIFQSAATMALATAAYATPQESVTFLSVDSTAVDGNAANQIRTNAFTGTYRVRSMRFAGQLTEVNTATFASEARIRVTDPSAATYTMQPFTTTSFTGSITLPAGTQINVGTPIASAAGTWTFRFYESLDDGADSLVDSTWNTITITLDTDYAAPAPPTGNEVTTLTGVDSNGVLDNAANSVRTAAFTGAYLTNRLRLTGLIIAGTAAGNQAGQARLAITPPTAARVLWQPTTSTATGLVQVTGPALLSLGSSVTTAGTWNFRFYENTDEDAGVDNVWDQVSIATVAAPAAPPPAQYSEIEPNETKATATAANPANDGVLLGGTSTGTGTTAASPANADYWRIKMPARPRGIYKHVLTLKTNGDAGHTGSIRGLTQTTHVITPGTDAALQTSLTVGTDRVDQWYGYGKQEELYYSVTGTTATTEPYYVTLATTPVTPVDLPALPPNVATTIETVGETGTTQTDTEIFLFDSNFVDLAHNDDEPSPGTTLGSSMTYTFTTAGTYYLAVSRFNTSDNLANPLPDRIGTGAVCDFPDLLVRGTTGTAQNVGFRVNTGTLNQNFPTTLAGDFDVAWFKVTVGSPCHGSCIADFDDGTGTGTPDGGVTIDDLLYYLAIFDQGLVCADVDDGTFTGTQDGGVTIDDLLYYLFHFDLGC